MKKSKHTQYVTQIVSIMTLVILNLASINSFASTQSTQKEWGFTYKPKGQPSFKIVKAASSQEAAFKIASKECFQKLTHGEYPGEEKGLDYIDVCANPKM